MEIDHRKREIGFALLILLIALALLAVSPRYAEGAAGSADALGPMFWPRVILLIIVAMSFINLFNIYTRDESTAEAVDAADKEEDETSSTSFKEEMSEMTPSGEETQNQVFFLVIAITAAYIGLLNTIGFMVLTPVYLATMFWVLGYRDLVRGPITAVVATAILIILFQQIMLIPLPRGVGVFRELSYVVLG